MRKFVFSCYANLQGAQVTVMAASEEDAINKIGNLEWDDIELCSASIADLRVNKLLAAEAEEE